jgi:hypothetical protein
MGVLHPIAATPGIHLRGGSAWDLFSHTLHSIQGSENMPGFRHCTWCSGKGCIACGAEQKKWEKYQANEAKRKAQQDPRDRLKELQNPIVRMIAEATGDDAVLQLNREIAEAEAACDAEYKRQFPDGPKPILSINLNDAKDVALKRDLVANAGNIIAEGGVESFIRKCEEATNARIQD